MDLGTVTATRRPRTREQLRLHPGEVYMSGGTWLLSEPQPGVTSLVDLTAMQWQPWQIDDHGLSIATTCTIDEISRLPNPRGWAAHPLIRQCCTALYGSFKVWNVATVGGNICAALPPGPMTTLAAGLDAEAVIWRADGTERRMSVEQLVTGLRQTALEPGELLQRIEIPEYALRARTAYRKIAQAEIGRSGAVLVARLQPQQVPSPGGEFVLTITASTLHPEVLRYPSIPTARQLQHDIDGISSWYTDPHGAADWREQMSRLLAEELRVELASEPSHAPHGRPTADQGGF